MTSLHDTFLNKIKKSLQKDGFVCKHMLLDKNSIDIIAVKNESTVWAIEVESGLSLKGLREGVGQAQQAIGWVHHSYIAIPLSHQERAMKLIRGTSIGLMSYQNNKIIKIKEAETLTPEREKLNDLLSRTVGFCWICGKTFNNIPPTRKNKWGPETLGSILIDGAYENKLLYEKLRQFTPQKERSYPSRWVRICTVCSSILGSAISEFFGRVYNPKFKETHKKFDFSEYEIKRLKKIIKRGSNEKR